MRDYRSHSPTSTAALQQELGGLQEHIKRLFKEIKRFNTPPSAQARATQEATSSAGTEAVLVVRKERLLATQEATALCTAKPLTRCLMAGSNACHGFDLPSL